MQVGTAVFRESKRLSFVGSDSLYSLYSLESPTVNECKKPTGISVGSGYKFMPPS